MIALEPNPLQTDVVPVTKLVSTVPGGYKWRSLMNILMDILFVVSTGLLQLGFSILPAVAYGPVTAALYFVFLYLFRYVYVHEIGDAGSPLFKRVTSKIPAFFQNGLNLFFGLVMAAFPGLLLVLCWFAATPDFSLDTVHPLITAGLGMVSVFFITINAVVFFHCSEENGSRPVNGRFFPKPGPRFDRILRRFIIPVLSAAAGCSISGISLIVERQVNDPVFLLFLTLAAFIPFRYLVIRTAGASVRSFVSFAIAVVLAVAAVLLPLPLLV